MDSSEPTSKSFSSSNDGPQRDEPPLGVIGIGLLGSAVCHRLLDQGYRLKVWSRFRHEAESVLDRGAEWSENPLAECDRVILCLYTSQVVADVVKALESGLHKGQTLIDMTTGSPEDAQRLARQLSERGIDYLEAPVSGSSVQTQQGQATILVGGDQFAFENHSDLWNSLGRSVYYTGQSGSASKMKLVTNLVLGLNRAALAEGLAFARSVGLDLQTALNILADSAAASRVMETKGLKMIESDFSVQARLSQHLKDVRLILQTGRDAGQKLPLSESHHSLLEKAEQLGCGDLDNSAIIQVYCDRNDRI